jgi:transposase
LNVLKSHLRITIHTLLHNGVSQREIERRIGVDRKTIRRYERAHTPAPANSPGVATGSGEAADQIPPPRPPAPPKAAMSACAAHAEFIQAQVQLGRNAQSIYQDLVEAHGFTHRYNSVKRFVRTLKVREPERFDVLESLPGEEAQVDFGLGAMTLHATGKYRRPNLFVMTLKYSGKCFRKTVWKADQETWARLHEEAFRSFGGSVSYVVLDNLKQGVIKPDLYEPQLNPVYAAVLAHYGAIADPCRVRDPDRKGAVENAIQHTQNTALKGPRFESIEAQNQWLAHWEERWAAPRIHGRKKRQVLQMYLEEKTRAQAAAGDGLCLLQAGNTHCRRCRPHPGARLVLRRPAGRAAYPSHRAHLHRPDRDPRRRGPSPAPLCQERAQRPIRPARARSHLQSLARNRAPDRQSQPDRTALSPAGARHLCPHGTPGQRAIYALANLPRHYTREQIEAACANVLTLSRPSYQALKRVLAHQPELPAPPTLEQIGEHIRAIGDYQTFWDRYTGQP